MEFKTVSGKSVFPIGIGTWGMGGKWEAETKDDHECIEAIRYSNTKGQNHIDSAELYGAGHTDEIIGEAIKGLSRKDLFIAEKLWKTSVAKGRVRSAINAVLKRLKTDYIDLIYIHHPWDEIPWKDAIPQIDELIDEGIVRYFGVSNFDSNQIEATMKLCRHPIVANQLHFNILFKEEATDSMLRLCENNDIQLVAYRPLERAQVLEDKVIQKIAEDRKATPTQIALAWLINHKALPIPKAIERVHIEQNIEALMVKLSVEDMVQLDNL